MAVNTLIEFNMGVVLMYLVFVAFKRKRDGTYYDPIAWKDSVLCSEPERAAFRCLLELGLCDSFRNFEQAENSFSWWDYRMNAFRRNRGLRIDHILVSDALREVCTACNIDKMPRAWERPSDHTPVIAEFALS